MEPALENELGFDRGGGRVVSDEGFREMGKPKRAGISMLVPTARENPGSPGNIQGALAWKDYNQV